MHLRLLLVLSPILATLHAAAPDGTALYQKHCSICHGAEGLGLAGVFPPLAKSDFLAKERERSLKAPLEGMSGRIEVNGEVYDGAMPPAFLDDAETAAVFNHVFSSWGNNHAPVSAGEISRLRAETKFPTLEKLKASMVGAELPSPPGGWKLEIGAELGFSPTRLALHPDGRSVLALSAQGDVWLWEPGKPETKKLFQGTSYIDRNLGEALVMGMATDSQGRLYITSNQRNTSAKPVRNEMTIFRTKPWTKGGTWEKPKPWFRHASPFGIGPYNHGLSHISQGPDGLLYINSGARTDGGEAGEQPDYSPHGEEPETAAIWRMDPEQDPPALSIYANGLRNTYGFCWDDAGRLFATENGPDAHCPEELNLIEKGSHYGFPYHYSDWTEKAYPHTPEAPEGLEITLPFRNLGPDGGKGLATFDPHSSPAGIVWLGNDWPAPLGGSFLTVRFGNLLQLEEDTGFDLLQLRANPENRTVQTNRLLFPLGRPIDLLKLPGNRLVIAEYSRETNFAAGMGTPGRLLILRPE